MKIPLVFSVVLLSIVAGWSLLHPGFPPTHDGEYHLIRFYEFDKAFRSGSFYPRIASDLNNGYGVPLFNYVYPLPNYVALILHAFGVSFIDAFKLNMFIAIILGAVFMYFFSKMYWGEQGGIVASIFYTFAPYHFLDIYIRGSVGEVWALALFPGFLWAATKLIKEEDNFFLPVTSVFLALIIFSHNILSLMFFPFALSYVAFIIVNLKKKKLLAVRSTLYSTLLGLSLSSVFWGPAIFERQYVRGLEVFDYRAHFVEIYQLIFPSWGSGFSADETTQGLSFQIGAGNLIAMVTVVVFMIASKKYRKIAINKLVIIWIFLSVIFMLPIAQFIWEIVPFINYFQFPWRFLSITILGCSFLAGSVVFYKQSKLLFLTFLAVPIVFGIGYTKLAYYHARDDTYYVTRSNFIDGTNSPGNSFNTVWFNAGLPKTSSFSGQTKEAVIVYKAYFPGWQVFVDGKKVKTGVDKNGLITISKPPQGSTIEAKFLDTPIRSLTSVIFIVSLTSSVFLLIKFLRARMKK